MKLFTRFFLLSLFLMNNSHGGGVTVGNGQGRIIVGITLQDRYLVEDQLMKSAEDIIHLIKNGEFGRINEMIDKGMCDPNYVKVEVLKSKRFYIIDNGVFKRDKEFVGYLQVELKDCQNMHAIMADEPYGGSEFWED